MIAKSHVRSCVIAVLLACRLWAPSLGRPADGDGVEELAARIVRSSGAAGGVCVVLGAPDAELALSLAREGPFVVQCLSASAERTTKLRDAIRSRGTYGTISADTLRGPRLPYVDNLINIVVASQDSLTHAGVPAEEVLRVLAPLGTVHFVPSAPGEVVSRLGALGAEVTDGGRLTFARKPWPADIDEWTHYLHGPDGNPVARDRVVGPPERYQWTAGPLWQRSHETDSSISTLVTARGRIFYIVDEAPISLAGQHSLPDKWFLAARDAFNGVDLWKVPIRQWGWREWKGSWFNTRPGDIPLNIQKRLVAAGDRVYVTLGYRAGVSELDARTGAVLKTYEGTERANEILLVDGTLILSLLCEGGARVAAYDASSGARRWAAEKVYGGSTVDYIKWKEMNGGITPPVLDPALNAATDGKSIALIDGADIVCLDAATGRERWSVPFPSGEADLKAGGIRSGGNLWIGTMILSHGVVLHASPSKLAALSAETGRILWSQPKRFIQHLWYEWKDVFVVDDLVWTWNADLAKGRTPYPTSANGYDVVSGVLGRSVPLGTIFSANHHHRCYRNKATTRYILASRRGTEFVDLEGGNHTVHNWVRGTCHVGMMPANGLHYAPPHPCQCYIDEKLIGMNALASSSSGGGRDGGRLAEEPEAGRLERGPAYGRVSSEGHPQGEEPDSGVGPLPDEEDWPAFRHDGMRTGAVATEIPEGLAPLWRMRVGKRVSPPIAVGDRVWAALVDEHQVICLDARDGRAVWSHFAGGRIDSPPTYHRGHVLSGSRDGWVYALRAKDGVLAWRFQAAPERRLIGAFGQLESAWPLHGSVLVQAGVAYVAAGRTSQLDGGIRVLGLDAESGAVRYRRILEGPDYAAGKFEENYELPMGSLPDILMGDGERIHMRAVAFDAELNLERVRPDLKMNGGLLDDSYFKRVPWTYGGEYARLIVHDGRCAYYLRMFDTLRGLDPTVFFTPGADGYLLFAKDAHEKKARWSRRVPVRARAMALAGNRLVVAGPPDVVDPEDPLGAFEGRKGGILQVIDPVSGRTIEERPLPSPPVFNGAAAARGKLYIADEAGWISCFGRS